MNNKAQYVHVANCHYYSGNSCISSTRHIDFESGPALYIRPFDKCWYNKCKETCLRRTCFPSFVIESTAYVIKSNRTTSPSPIIHVLHSTTTPEPTTTTPKPTRAPPIFTTAIPLIHEVNPNTTPKPTTTSKQTDDNKTHNIIDEYYAPNHSTKTQIVNNQSNLKKVVTTITSKPTTTFQQTDDDKTHNTIDEYYAPNRRGRIQIGNRLSNLNKVPTTPSPRFNSIPECRDQYRCNQPTMNQIIYGQVPSSSSASSSASASGSSASASASASSGSSSSSSASSPYISYPGFSYQYQPYQPCQTQSQFGYVGNPCTVN